jgi:hypothetical protein
MTPAQFKKFLLRDRYCPHCGIEAPYLVPHHRKNRGMGGSKGSANDPSNILSVCAELNGLMESDSKVADQARLYGWKLYQYEDPEVVPIYDSITGFAYRLTNDYKRISV